MQNKPIEWPNQFAHMLFSSTVLLGAAFTIDSLVVLTGTTAGVLVFAAVKEFLDADSRFGTATQSAHDAFLDFLFFVVGLGITWIYIGVLHALKP